MGNTVPMLLVIFGAGASYDSIPGAQPRPPLAAELFDPRDDFLEVLRGLPAATSLVQRLRRQAPTGGGVERVLGEFMQRALETDDPHLWRDVIGLRFYLQQVVQRSTDSAALHAAGATNYLELVTRLYDWAPTHDEVAFVTFNYDTLLESAISTRFPHDFRSLDDYITAPMPVFKPHGSVNWVQELPSKPHLGLQGAQSFPYMHPDVARRTTELDMSQPGPVSMYDHHRLGVGAPKAAVPAIAVPMDNKDAFVFPAQHEQRLRTQLPEVDRLIVIGWRATETHFTELCRRLLRSHQQGLRSLVVDKGQNRNNAGRETMLNFAPHLHAGITTVATDGFSNFLNSPQLETFLAVDAEYPRLDGR